MPDLFDPSQPTPAGRTDEWLTGAAIIAALGGWQSFDLDPCAPAVQPWPTARAVFTRAENGLLRGWRGRCWVNPPYSRVPLSRFMARLAAHGWGTALIPAATDTETFARFVWGAATAVFFPTGRLTFHRLDGSPARRAGGGGEQRADHASAFCAYGEHDAERLAQCGIPGQFVALRIPRGWLVALGPAQLSDDGGQLESWRDLIARHMRKSQGSVRLDDLYRAISDHPKVARNPNWRAKVRQQLQRLRTDGVERVGRGEWRARA